MSGIITAAIIAGGAGIGGGLLAAKGGRENAAAIRDAATQQGTSNIDLARVQNILNNPNIRSYLGNQDITFDASGRPVVTQTLSPEEQAKYGKTNAIQTGLLDILQGNLPNIQEAISGKFGLAGSPQAGFAAGQAPTSLDFSRAPGMPSADARVLQQVEDAMYGQGAQYLDPQYKQMEESMRSRLANQGITMGSEASNTELENFRLGKQKAYGDLTQSSILSGQQAMKNLYEMALQGRQQGVGEAISQGTFGQQGTSINAQIAQAQMAAANAARQQAYSEMVGNKTLPVNLATSLMTGSQVNAPQFPGQQPTSINTAPLFAGAVQAAQANQAGFNAGANIFGQALGVGAKFLPNYYPTPTPGPDLTQGAGK
jgi:hypothetical protein